MKLLDISANSAENTVTSLIIPIYNEEANLPRSLELITQWLNASNEPREVVFFDDGSVDKTPLILKEAAKSDARIRLIRQENNLGKGAAVKLGMLEAHGKYRLFTDCDLAYGLESLRRIEEKLRITDCDVAVGSRALHPDGYGDYSSFRRLTSKAYMSVLRHAAELTNTDSQCGIKGFTDEAAMKIFANCHTDGYAFDLEVLMLAKRLRLKVVEIPVKIIEHSQQRSKVKPVRDALKMLGDVRKIKNRIDR